MNAQHTKQIEFKTELGRFIWIPDKEAFDKCLLSHVEQAVNETENQSLSGQARLLVNSYLDPLIRSNLQHAIIQAAEELIVLARASAAKTKQDRNQLAEAAAEKAKKASLARLKGIHYFPKGNRGEKRPPTANEFISKYIGPEQEILRVIKQLMGTAEGKKPTMSKVAAFMNRGQQNTASGNDSGERSLSRLLKTINPGQKARDVFNRLVQQAKTELSNTFGSSEEMFGQKSDS